MTLIARTVVRRLLNRPRTAQALYARLKWYSENDIDIALTSLIRDGVITVTCKRFYIRDRARAMMIANEVG